jgi:hypothetical protein
VTTSLHWLCANRARRPKLPIGWRLARRMLSNSSPTPFMPTSAMNAAITSVAPSTMRLIRASRTMRSMPFSRM